MNIATTDFVVTLYNSGTLNHAKSLSVAKMVVEIESEVEDGVGAGV